MSPTMAQSSKILELAWRQLELENPEYINRLRQLKEEQGKNQKTECVQASRPFSHVQKIFQELTSPEFSSIHGDVTLVFKDNERIHFYKSILTLMKHEWNMLHQLFSKNTEVVILPDTTEQEFFDEMIEKNSDLTADSDLKGDITLGDSENYRTEENMSNINWQTTAKEEDILLSKSKEEHKKENIQLWSSCLTCNEAIEGNNFDMDHFCSFQCTSCLKQYRTEDKLLKHKEKHGRGQQTLTPTYFCNFCKKYVNNFARHKREAHRIGKPVIFPCSTCGKEFMRKFDLQKHMPKCRCP